MGMDMDMMMIRRERWDKEQNIGTETPGTP